MRNGERGVLVPAPFDEPVRRLMETPETPERPPSSLENLRLLLRALDDGCCALGCLRYVVTAGLAVAFVTWTAATLVLRS